MNFKNICAIAALIFITFDTSCAAKKKEIFIQGPTQEVIAEIHENTTSNPEFRKIALEHHVSTAAETKLIELYAKEHPLPTLKKHEQNLGESIKRCESRTADEIRTLIASEKASERFQKLSQKDLQDYYEKIRANPSEYPKAKEVFIKDLPPFSEDLKNDLFFGLQFILLRGWMDEEESLLAQTPIETLKRDPVYMQGLKECKERRAGFFRPLKFAFDEFIFKKAQQKVQGMSNGQVKKYYEQHPLMLDGKIIQQEPFSNDRIGQIRQSIVFRIYDDLAKEALRSIAQKYTFKSDSPEVLAFIEELKSGKDQS